MTEAIPHPIRLTVTGIAYIDSAEPDVYRAEGEAARLGVERSDANEVRLGIQLKDSESDDATFYLTVAEASRLAHVLGVAVLDA
jgi:hypothetical protein